MTHASSLISALRSVSLNVPDLKFAEDFFTRIWRLEIAARGDKAIYLRGTGQDHHLLALHEASGNAQIRMVTLRAHSREALHEIVQRLPSAGGTLLQAISPVEEPGGGESIIFADPHWRIFQIIVGDEFLDAEQAHRREEKDSPIKLAHAVLNSHDTEASREFLEKVLDFSLADRTVIMAFMRCNSDHHSIAFGDTDNDALNHIAFVMPDFEGVMRGGGRMKDAGYNIEWGPGRHGPGNNTFNYFVGPFDVVIEYTADIAQVDDSYQTGYPADWKWPPGRVDQWGISAPPSPRLKTAQKAITFVKPPIAL